MTASVEFWKTELEMRSKLLGYGWDDSWLLVHEYEGDRYILANPPHVYKDGNDQWFPNMYMQYREPPQVKIDTVDRWTDSGRYLLNWVVTTPRSKLIIHRLCLVVKIAADGRVVDGALNDQMWMALRQLDAFTYWVCQ